MLGKLRFNKLRGYGTITPSNQTRELTVDRNLIPPDVPVDDDEILVDYDEIGHRVLKVTLAKK